jgi:hypothetical protein
VYVGTGAGRFDPARQALVFDAQRELEQPLGSEDRRSYQSELKHLLVAESAPESSSVKIEKWAHLFRDATPDFDAQGRPVMRIQRGEEVVTVGVSPSNILDNDAAKRITQQLLKARLHAELRRGSSPKISESDVARDWELLQKSRNRLDTEASVRANRLLQNGSSTRSERAGNRP